MFNASVYGCEKYSQRSVPRQTAGGLKPIAEWRDVEIHGRLRHSVLMFEVTCGACE
jgi:hypothetical protein